MKKIHNHTGKDISICVLCGDKLEHLDKPIVVHCDNCRATASATSRCESGHIICDNCMNQTVNEFIKEKCLAYTELDPTQLAVEIMNSPLVQMHGAEHHFILPAVMLTVTKDKISRKDTLSELLDIAEERAMSEICVDCKFEQNTCGAALGAGVFLEMFNGIDEQTEGQWAALSGELTSKCLAKIEEHRGPRCCKRDTYFAIQASVEFLKEKFAIDLPTSTAKCTFSLRNRSCGREECTFYSLSNSLV